MPAEASADAQEQARIQALHSYKILDTDPEQAFDDLTILASHICDTPVALISLIDSSRQWFKSRVGLSVSETPRELAFCNIAIQQPNLFIVPDATKDPRFSSNPFVVSDPKIRTAFAASAADQCVRCHDHENSPHFDYATYWPRIKHGREPKQ